MANADRDYEFMIPIKYAGLDGNIYLSERERNAADRAWMERQDFGRRSFEELLNFIPKIPKKHLEESLLGYRGADGMWYPTKKALREAELKENNFPRETDWRKIEYPRWVDPLNPWPLDKQGKASFYMGMDGKEYPTLQAKQDADELYLKKRFIEL